MRGIYKIQNAINNKIYIGESLDILRRWEEHINELKNKIHYNKKLQNDWNKYGEENFTFNIISVLDDSIENFLDKYILLIYEDYYIKKYNSLNDGYNNELTLDKIFQNKKTIVNNHKDIGIIKKYQKKINDGLIKEIGGIIYTDCFYLKDVHKFINIKGIELKKILFNSSFMILNENKNCILNEEIFNKEDIFDNTTYSKIKFNRKIYTSIIEHVSKILKSQNIELEEKKESNKNLTIEEKHVEHEKYEDLAKTSYENLETMRDFINHYTLNVKYNDVFKFLRDNEIFKYVDVNGKKYNYPTDKYLHCFIIKENKNDKNIFIKLFLNDDGKQIISKILLDNKIISKKIIR